MKKIEYFIIFVILLTISSCLNRQFVDGHAELVLSSDSSLNDSSLIFGHIYHVDWTDNYHYFEHQFEILIENSNLKTTNDSTGNYLIKTIPGTYTIKCQSTSNEWERLIEEMKDIEIGKNKKIQIDFYIGYTIE